jgi:hypothetical protein
MLSLPNDGRYPALELAAEQRRQRVLEALMSQLAGLARWQPVLMIFEDVHWILLALCGPRVESAAVADRRLRPSGRYGSAA